MQGSGFNMKRSHSGSAISIHSVSRLWAQSLLTTYHMDTGLMATAAIGACSEVTCNDARTVHVRGTGKVPVLVVKPRAKPLYSVYESNM